MSRIAPRLIAGAAAVGIAAGLVAFAAPASAHVTVVSGDAKQGGYGVLTFRVPTESATASTVKLVVQMPTATPLASVGVQPTPGWSSAETMTKLSKPITTDDGDQITEAVSTVTWTATAGGTKPGQFQQFYVQVGPLPKAAQVRFPAIQTYSDGSVVSWNQTAAPGAAEPDHPAPTLTLTAATTTSASAAPTAAASNSSSDDGGSDTGPIVLSIIALVVAVAALAFGVVSRARTKATS